MSEHFIREIEIKNFKCFKDFKAEGFGRVNLIGGKNNVGKTAFMEASYTNVYSKNFGNFIIAFVKIKNQREIVNILHDYADNVDITFRERFFYKALKNSSNFDAKTNIRKTIFIRNNKNGILKYIFKIDKKEYIFKSNSIPTSYNSNVVFLGVYGLANKTIVDFYSLVQKEDKEEFLNEILKIIDTNIDKFKILKDKPYCKINDTYLELTELGNGVQEFISIVLSLYRAKNSYVFIDEIAKGIHYSSLDKLWEIILNLSRELNVQVFATTHSKECIESYARVSKKLEDNEIRFIELGRNRKDEIKALVMDSDRFQREIDMDNEVRGW